MSVTCEFFPKDSFLMKIATSFINFTLELRPKILNGVKIRRTCWSQHNTAVPQPKLAQDIACVTSCVGWSIVVHKYHLPLYGRSLLLVPRKENLLEEFYILLSIHFYSIRDSKQVHNCIINDSCPNHDIPTTLLSPNPTLGSCTIK